MRNGIWFRASCRCFLGPFYKAIQLLDEGLGENGPRWTFENKAESIVGAGDYVISENRHNFPSVERDANLQHVEELRSVVASLEAMVVNLTAEVMDSQGSSFGGDDAEFTVEYEAMLLASLIIGTMSLVLVLSGLALYAVRSNQVPEEKEK